MSHGYIALLRINALYNTLVKFQKAHKVLIMALHNIMINRRWSFNYSYIAIYIQQSARASKLLGKCTLIAIGIIRGSWGSWDSYCYVGYHSNGHNDPGSNTNSNTDEVEYPGNVCIALSFSIVSSWPGRVHLHTMNKEYCCSHNNIITILYYKEWAHFARSLLTGV